MTLFDLLSLFIVLTAHDEARRILLHTTGLDAHSLFAPRSTRSITADRALTFTTTMRVIAGVHDEATNGWANPEVTGFAGFADIDEVPILVADLTDGRAADGEDFPHLARSETKDGIGTVRAKHLSARSGSAAHLATFARLKLDVMDEGTIGDVRERAVVADFDVGVLAAYDLVADVEILRTDDVTLFAIGVGQEGDEGRAVRIVFDRFHGRRDFVFVATEVDDTIAVLVATADVTAGDDSLIIAPTRMFLRVEQ